MEGLSESLIPEQRKKFGNNEIEVARKFSVLKLFLGQFPTLINAILLLAAIFSFVLSNTVDGLFILLVLLANGIFSFLQEYRAEKAIEKLQALTKQFCTVIRDGAKKQIPVDEVVVGDTVVLLDGDRIPADGKTISTTHLEIDEAILTGESLPVVKKSGDELFRGTFVNRGKGVFTVTDVGKNTRFGQIASSLSEIEEPQTPLQKQLTSATTYLSLIAIIIATLLIPIGVLRHEEPFPLILLAVSIAVAAIPESIPGVVTIALAIGANRMARKSAIVRKMAAIETVGALQVVLVDKTGTITQNRMEVKESWVAEEKLLPWLFRACVIGNTASIEREDHSYEIIGDKTDGALILWTEKHTSLQKLKDDGEIIDEYTFDPVTKTITTVWQEHKHNYVFVKGAPEAILSRSKLSEKEKDKYTALYEKFASEGLRIIAFGYKETKHNKSRARKEVESNLTFLGFLGIYDPPRDEAKHTILAARQAGIDTVMVTGDNEITALSIAQQIGLAGDNEEVITGWQLKKMEDEELAEKILITHVFARTTPEDKLRLVEAYKKLGFLVGVTGDGVNDALALKKADVGIAMGEKGTDVARETADIVLTNDNFATIIQAIKEGRGIYANLVKAITYLLSGNLSEILLITLAIILGAPTPLLPTQILWMNLVTDVFPALGLAFDTTDSDVLHQKNHFGNSQLISLNRGLLITLIGVSLAVVLFTIFTLLLPNTGYRLASTIIFNVIILTHVALAFILRGKAVFHPNKLLVVGTILTIIAQFSISTIPFFQNIFHLGW